MQGNEKILSNNIAKLLRQIRKSKNKSLNLFCNEYSIPTSTLNDIEHGKTNIKLISLYKILKAYNINMTDFIKDLEKNLPDNFMITED